MPELKIVATIIAKEEFKEQVEAAIIKCVDGTRQEPGNNYYILHRDVNAPLNYVLQESWKSQQMIDRHEQSDHFQTFLSEVDGKIESLSWFKITEIY
ncbi:MAG: putative quinol monooxygenase [Rikenellaceae bacterium]